MGIRLTVSKLITSDVERLAFLKQRMADDKKEFEALRAKIDVEIGDKQGIQAGNVLIMKKPCSRTTLDKKALVERVGEDIVNACSKVTEFFQWQITEQNLDDLIIQRKKA